MSTPSDAPTSRILIIDDEPALLRLLGRILGRAHQTLFARDSVEALSLVREHAGAIDAVLCDVTIADTTGPELREQIAVEYPALARRFTFMTGGALDPAQRAQLHAAGCAVLDKPLEPTALLAHVADVVRTARSK